MKASAAVDGKADESAHPSNRTRPPITNILDTCRGCPASGVEVHLEMRRGSMTGQPTLKGSDGGWASLGSSHTNSDGRSGGALMDIVDNISPGFYRISFNTGVYNPHGFFPFVSIVFQIKESQSTEHFHVLLLLPLFHLVHTVGASPGIVLHEKFLFHEIIQQMGNIENLECL